MKPTHRMVEGTRIEGLSRHALHRTNGRFDLVYLTAYADSTVSVGLGHPSTTWTFDRFVEAVGAGDVVAHVEDGTRVHAYGFGDWTVADAASTHDDPKALITEIADAVDRLNGRPDTIDRFWTAIHAYGREQSPESLADLRARLDDVPETWGWLIDSEESDAVYRILCHEDGGKLWPGSRTVSDAEAATARAWLAAHVADCDSSKAEAEAEAERARCVTPPTVELYEVNFAHPAPPDTHLAALRNEFPLDTLADGRTYPSPHHAYYALSILDEAGREAVAREPMGMRVPHVAGGYEQRPDWPAVHLAVMAELVRTKFRTHAELADMLVSTGDARIVYRGLDPFWSAGTDGHGHWMGRLLELLRAELVLTRPAATEGPDAAGSA
ncbi:NADAR domain-containing protein [Streptomyces sp. NPDC101490]|uniref:DUF7638 domain-containing protein n=1 Tax=Streptomyces sp. NPDC101490 TaxID=3366143 RepID=UPI003817CF73